MNDVSEFKAQLSTYTTIDPNPSRSADFVGDKREAEKLLKQK